MAKGTVKWFNPTKGCGFIKPQGGGKDVFVRISAVERAGLSTLNEGQVVQYEVVANRGKEPQGRVRSDQAALLLYRRSKMEKSRMARWAALVTTAINPTVVARLCTTITAVSCGPNKSCACVSAYCRSVRQNREARSGAPSCRSVVGYGGGLRVIAIGPEDDAC